MCREVEAGDIVALLLLSQASNIESDGIFFCFEALKNIPQVNYGKQPAARSNVGACSQKYSG